ncbi:Protein of unknown function [Cotesia congregata]|uniref:Uncharacterized protein n=1 Tax=Cotesia congregata TaxID=51543 RepID=A0A8J2MNV5_COTCN|nr:Protein of unknown function [Cotesia congregata]
MKAKKLNIKSQLKPTFVMMKEFPLIDVPLIWFRVLCSASITPNFDLDSNEPDNQSITPVQSAETIEQEAENKFGDDETATHSSA